MWVGEELSHKLEVVKRSFDTQWRSNPCSEVDHNGECCQVTNASDFGFSQLKLVMKKPHIDGISILLPIHLFLSILHDAWHLGPENEHHELEFLQEK